GETVEAKREVDRETLALLLRCRTDELPAALPRPAVLHLQRDVEDPERLERARHRERPGVDGAEADGARERERLRLRVGVIRRDEAVERHAVHRRVRVARREGVVEGLRDLRLRGLALDLLRRRRT